jgi:glycosyltransferase involved in cell wall biosynthesis
MNVLFDGQVFSFQEHGGISRYYCELFKHFSQLEGIEPSFIIKYSNNRILPELNLVHFKHFFSSYRFKGRNEIIKLLNRMYVRNNFHTLPAPHVFHPTYYDPYFLDLLGDIPFVLTIYDMSHELYPKLFSRFDFTAENKKKLSAKADRIIAISEHTKKDIIGLLHIPESKVDVIPLATNLSLTGSTESHFPLPDNYILFVGKRNTYKNFSFLLEAMNLLPRTYASCSLICAGGGTFTAQERNEIDKFRLSGRIIHMDADDHLLIHLYSHAQAFVFPSLYEGFGIPVLESFVCGCPALLSNRSCLPEVGGIAARYFNPESVSSLVECLTDVIEDKALAGSMRIQGFDRVKLFSWKNTALKTVETYKKVLRS